MVRRSGDQGNLTVNGFAGLPSPGSPSKNHVAAAGKRWRKGIAAQNTACPRLTRRGYVSSSRFLDRLLAEQKQRAVRRALHLRAQEQIGARRVLVVERGLDPVFGSCRMLNPDLVNAAVEFSVTGGLGADKGSGR